ncbi:MAG: efflux RND transporter permease subunit [Deltaproteobacteria bacterium]|jgi:HAE1 family hydrophobic/amphiphilic exporter-1|nr:efflux RND transporter permease subunit [Deltaproteobacteria bacterium]
MVHRGGIKEAGLTGAFPRLQAALRTSMAFLAGLPPLVFATDPGAVSRLSVLISVFGGMIATSALGVTTILPLYVTFQKHGSFSSTRWPRVSTGEIASWRSRKWKR